MEAQKVDLFIMSNSKFFESHKVYAIREALLNVDNSKWGQITSLQFTDPTITLIVSILAGVFGVDRFMIGDVGLGVGKLLTCGGLGVWSIVDWFLIQKATQEKNADKLRQVIG